MTRDRETVARFFEEFVNQRRFEIASEIFTPSFIDHNPVPGASSDLDSFVSTFQRLFIPFPDLVSRIDAQVDDGKGLIATRFSWTGTHSAPLLGVAATGRQVHVKAMYFDRLHEGRIAERWRVYDALDMFGQLGVTLTPKSSL